MMVRICGARRVLEVGTLGGYSALWMARGMADDGEMVTLENNPVCAGVARANFAHAGLAERIELRYGDAIDSFKALVGEKGAPFDFIFIDANKPDYPEYLHWAVRLSRPGTVIVADNIVRHGAVANAKSDDPAVVGVRQFLEDAAAHKKLEMAALQTVGAKGYDGFAVLRVI
jgi:predicted O-methyltransferase YrrM